MTALIAIVSVLGYLVAGRFLLKGILHFWPRFLRDEYMTDDDLPLYYGMFILMWPLFFALCALYLVVALVLEGLGRFAR